MSNTPIVIPCDYDEAMLEQTVFTEWWSDIIFDFFNTLQKTKHKREYEVLRHRFGLDGLSTRTLEEVGIIFDVSRERIRQIEKQAFSNLAELVNTGQHIKRRLALHPAFFRHLADYRKSFENLNAVEMESLIIQHTQAFFSLLSFGTTDLPELRLLLTVFGFQPLSLGKSIGQEKEAWILQNISVKRVEAAMQAIADFLREAVIAKSRTEIKLGINSALSPSSRFSEDEFGQAMRLLTDDIEILEDGSIQLRFEKLRSLADKAYRIMHEHGEPMHARQIAIVLNRESFRVGEKSDVNAHNVGARLSSDPRFKPIGRSGEWILSGWDEISTDSVQNLMTHALHAAGQPLSSQEIFDYVSQRRPVRRSAVNSYLRYEQKFVRVGRDLFALSDWGMKSVSASIGHPRKRILSRAKLCEYIELVFSDHEIETMYVSDLAHEIAQLEPELSSASIYNQILRSPAIEVVDTQKNSQIRKLAVFNPNFRTKLTKRDILTKDVAMGELIQSTVRSILRKHAEHQSLLAELRDAVSSELQCPPASVYSAISAMEQEEDIEKFRDETGQVRVRLVSVADDFALHLARIKDPKLLGEVQRALNLLHIDTIDLALFQLGKIFEHTLKTYMLAVQQTGKHPVTNEDLKRLHNMVQWAGRQGIISDETALQYLRIERNDRGHGSPPDTDERQALLNNAPTLVRFYLDYILLLHERTMKLSCSS